LGRPRCFPGTATPASPAATGAGSFWAEARWCVVPTHRSTTTEEPPVLLIGSVRDCRAAAGALHGAGVSQLRCDSSASALAACERPRAVLICLQALSGEQTRELRCVCEDFPDSPVLLLAARLQRWELRAVLGAGAAGALLADESLSQRIMPCLHAAASGQLCAPLQLGNQIAQPPLSAREKQVLGLVTMGYMNCQIAERLYLAESTVKSHLSSAFAKLGVRSRNEAVSLILDPEHGRGMGIIAIAEHAPAPEPLASR
jgi:DNA-binding NarL/FixJ family response regulator